MAAQRVPRDAERIGGRARAPSLHGVETFGPPGWTTQRPMSATLEALVGEELLDVGAEMRRTTSATVGARTIRNPVAPMSQPMTPLGVRIEPGPAGHHARAGERPAAAPARPPP